MKIVMIVGASHLDEAFVRTPGDQNYHVIGIDRTLSDFTDNTGT